MINLNLLEKNHQDQANKKKVAQKIKKKNVTNNFQLHQKKKKKVLLEYLFTLNHKKIKFNLNHLILLEIELSRTFK